jgi:hypothetical protein
MAQVSAIFPQFKPPIKTQPNCKSLISSGFLTQLCSGMPEAKKIVSVELKPTTKQLTKLEREKIL